MQRNSSIVPFWASIVSAITMFSLVCLIGMCSRPANGLVSSCTCQPQTMCQLSDQNGQAVFRLLHRWDYDKAPLMSIYYGGATGAMWTSTEYQFITDGTVVANVPSGQTVCLVYIE